MGCVAGGAFVVCIAKEFLDMCEVCWLKFVHLSYWSLKIYG